MRNMHQKINEYLDLLNERGPFCRKTPLFSLITDPNEIMEYIQNNRIELGIIYKSRFHILVNDLIKNSQGEYFVFERLLNTDTGNAVVIAASLNDQYILLQQYRYAIGKYQFAFPRGFGEPTISVVENCKKELIEELGCKVDSVQQIGTVVADSGVLPEEVNLLKCEVSDIHIINGYEGINNYRLVDRETLKKMIANNEINDSFTLAAVAILESKGLL